MFYSHEILQRRSGSFGVIWLASTQNKSLTRREYEKVKISQKCEEIIAVMNGKLGQGKRFSLYLLAQLMYGTVKVFYQQNRYLLTDCLEIEKKIRKGVIRQLLDVPDAALETQAKLCLTIDFSILFPDTPEDEINPQICYDVQFLQDDITGLPRDAEQMLPILADVDISANTAPKHTITLTESAANTNFLNYPNFNQVTPEMDLAPMAAGDWDQLLNISPVKQLPELEPLFSQPEVPPPESAVPAAIQAQLERTAEPPLPSSDPPAEPPRRKSAKRPSADVTVTEPEQARKKRRPISTLVLPPLEDEPPQEPRPIIKSRKLVDEIRWLSKEKCKSWQSNCAPTVRAPTLPNTRGITLNHLMTRPSGEGHYISKWMRSFFNQLCTEPTSLATAVLPAVEGRSPQRVDQPNQRDQSMDLSAVRRKQSSAVIDEISINTSAKSSRRNTRDTSHQNTTTLLDKEPLPPVDENLPPPNEPVDIPLPEPVQPELPMPDVPETNIPVVEQGNELSRRSLDPSLIIQSEAAIADVPETIQSTPRTMSIKAKLSRSIKAHLQLYDSIAFTELHDIIQADKTPRIEVAQLFNCLLSKAKNREVNLTQEEPYAPIMVTRDYR